MKTCSGLEFPNEHKKSRIFEVHLSYRDFGCNPEDYYFDLELTREQEKNGNEICEWYIDTDGRMIVSGLSLNGTVKRIEIINNSFKEIGAMQKVFISYAKEDYNSAKKLYNLLKEDGFDPWLDEENLLPGQKWEVFINDAIKECHYFIALLSSKSVEKRGYVQKELRKALDILELVPERKIFLIPVRLDECQPTHPILDKIHRVDLFPDDNWQGGYFRIKSTLMDNHA